MTLTQEGKRYIIEYDVQDSVVIKALCDYCAEGADVEASELDFIKPSAIN